MGKVALYKEDRKKAFEIAQNENASTEVEKDDVLETLKEGLCKFGVNNIDLAIYLRNSLDEIIKKSVDKKTQKFREQSNDYANKNENLEISNLTLNRQYKELLDKFNAIKDENYNLKQNVQTRVIKDREQDAIESALLKFEDFKSPTEQLQMLVKKSKKSAVYDKKGRIIIKFPGTDFLTQECRKGSSRYLQAKAEWLDEYQCWALSEFANIFKTLDFLKRNRFVFSKELETVEYHQRNHKK